MTTASTNTPMGNSSNAAFQQWVTEVIVQLLAVGVTQTTDTGQMANPCVTAAPVATATSAGYYVFKFNDTLQATSPIFFRLDFGAGAATTTPALWITVGTGSNGSGTINGTTLAKFYTGGNATGSASNFTSRFCYNATQGFLGVVLKIGQGATNCAEAGFLLYRSVNASGAPTADAAMLLTNSNGTTVSSSGGYLSIINYDTSTSSASGTFPVVVGNAWGFIPFSNLTGAIGTTAQVFPVFQPVMTASAPGIGITNAVALAVNADIPIGGTDAINILGSLSYTYINVGSLIGAATGGLTFNSYSVANYGIMMLWQ